MGWRDELPDEETERLKRVQLERQQAMEIARIPREQRTPEQHAKFMAYVRSDDMRRTLNLARHRISRELEDDMRRTLDLARRNLSREIDEERAEEEPKMNEGTQSP